MRIIIITLLMCLQGFSIAANRPRSIYQYSSMAPRLSGQTSIFGVVFFVPKSLWELRDKINLESLQFLPESLGAMLEY